MSNPAKKRFVRLAGSILAAVLLFLSTGPDAHAQAAYDVYGVKIYFGTDTTICVGQTTTITVSKLVRRKKRPQSFLSRSPTDRSPRKTPPREPQEPVLFILISMRQKLTMQPSMRRSTRPMVTI